MELKPDQTMLTTTDIMNILQTAMNANERAGRVADCATMMGALKALILIEERQYLGALVAQLRKEQK